MRTGHKAIFTSQIRLYDSRMLYVDHLVDKPEILDVSGDCEYRIIDVCQRMLDTLVEDAKHETRPPSHRNLP